MSQFYVNPENIDGPVFRLDGTEAAHLLHVLRARRGDRIKLFDGRGNAWYAEIEKAGNNIIEGHISGVIKKVPRVVNLKLCFALPARKAFDDILERCTVAEVSVFQPVVTERVQESRRDWNKRIPRMRQIVMSACKQCGRADFPEILPPVRFDECIAGIKENEAAFIASFGGIHTGQLPEKINGRTELLLFTGPEGGFTEEEIRKAVLAGAVPLDLGRNVLRAEDACFYASMVLTGYKDCRL